MTATQIRDLEDPDLDALLEAFYATITRDPLLGPYFIDLDMREHMPRIVTPGAIRTTPFARTSRCRASPRRISRGGSRCSTKRSTNDSRDQRSSA